MPINLAGKRALVVDHGAFVELALRLARKGGFGEVYYCDPSWETAYAKIDHAVIGDGFEQVRRVKEPWALIDGGEVDIVIFPDVHHGEMQAHIESLGLPVWGARSADQLELHKLRFKKIQDELGMPHADYDVIYGMLSLREYCARTTDRYIKITPQFRGNRETFHHSDPFETAMKLAQMDLEFGPLGDILTFLCEHPLKGKIEGGIDTYTVDGQHPDQVVSGWEIKDKCYLAEVLAWGEVNQVLRDAIDPLWPILKARGTKQMISTEVKIEDKVLLEPTIRFPSPGGEQQMELYENFPEIIWEGAHGRLVQPEVTYRYACTAMIDHDGDSNHTRAIRVPESVRRWVKLYNVSRVGDLLATAPGNETIGAAIGLGSTVQEALERLKEVAEALKDQPVKVHVEDLAKALQEAQEAKEKGAGMEGTEVPESAEAVT